VPSRPTASNRLAAIPFGLFRFFPSPHGAITVSQGGMLNSPLGLALAPNGHLLTVNGGDGRLVETTPFGRQVASRFLDTSGSPPGAGALFGLAVTTDHHGIWFVDDADNTLDLQH
jgi:hypothetical protein